MPRSRNLVPEGLIVSRRLLTSGTSEGSLMAVYFALFCFVLIIIFIQLMAA